MRYAETTGGLLAALILFVATVTAEGRDLANGRDLFEQCRRCHQIGSDARHRIGPHLNGLFGRTAGSLGDYAYSAAMKTAGEKGLVWNVETLDTFLAHPRKLVPRSRMSFKGLPGDRKRQDLIAWLQRFSSGMPDLPPAQATATTAEYGLDPKVLAVRGDPDYGAYLASECTGCHRADGIDMGIPSITGWPIDDFVIAMQAYRYGKRSNPAMQNIAKRLNDDEIAALAVHFRSLLNVGQHRQGTTQ